MQKASVLTLVKLTTTWQAIAMHGITHLRPTTRIPMPGMLGTIILPWLQVALGSRHNQKGEIYKPGYGSLVSHEGTA